MDRDKGLMTIRIDGNKLYIDDTLLRGVEGFIIKSKESSNLAEVTITFICELK